MKRTALMILVVAFHVRGQDGEDPYARRPVCASMFLNSEFQLSKKQITCDWIQKRMFSPTALVTAAGTAVFSQITERASDRGKGMPGFMTRFSENFAQNAFKSTGAYLGGALFREDPRRNPPYLAMRTQPPPRGFWKRTGYALKMNVMSYRCTGACTSESDIKTVPAFSRVAGSFASGFSSELWAADRLNSPGRALRRSASAYGSTFMNSLFIEFQPEISALAGKVITAIFGTR